uniref:Uncharacterized protein n=1 Tax=uncultured Thiotrichaceae bacterium TaxID=298394 RepID=A0A6S6ULM6_9GAMM|nr:MAG: Unknown protein [uncultured Thiotrichaceae bacterium]
MSNRPDAQSVSPPEATESSKTFCALNLFKWAAMLLMFGIAFGEFYVHGAGDANWVFIGFCVVFGLILLWAGHILAKHSIAAEQANLRRKSAMRKVRKSGS